MPEVARSVSVINMGARCKDCRFWAKGTIAASGCYRHGIPKHALSGACKQSEPRPPPLKIAFTPPKLI